MCRTRKTPVSTVETIESIIFDWGGVLIDDPAPGLMRYCAAVLGVSTDDYARVHDRFAQEFQKGLISEVAFWAKVCAGLRVSRPRVVSLWGRAFRSVYSPRQDVFSMAASLQRAGYRTAFLSNTEVPAMRYFRQLRYEMFDVAVFSCAERASKPERRIYEIVLERLGSQPAQAVLIDDRADYIEGAKKVSLNTILFGSVSQVKADLARLSVRID